MHLPLFWQGLLEHALSFDAGHPKEIEIAEEKTSQNSAVTDLVIFVGVIFQKAGPTRYRELFQELLR